MQTQWPSPPFCWLRFLCVHALLNVNYGTTQCGRCCGHRVRSLPSQLTYPPPTCHAHWWLLALKLGSCLFLFVYRATLLCLWKGCSIARRTRFSWTISIIYTSHVALITYCPIPRYIRVSYPSCHCKEPLFTHSCSPTPPRVYPQK